MDLRTLTITPELLRIISEIDAFNGGWKAQAHFSPGYLTQLRHVATIESIGSSTRIEGSKLADSEIEDLLGKVGLQSFASRDEQEVMGYADVMETVYENFAHIAVTENYIKQLHITLLRHSGKDARHRGEYKKHSNSIEAFDASGNSLGVVFETASAFETPAKIQELVYWTRESLADNSLHPLIVIAIFNVVFLAIHPFEDGNGRLSRVLVSLLMLKAGYDFAAYSSLESIIEKNKDAYYLALQRTQKTLHADADWLPWLNFFMRSLQRQKDHLKVKSEEAGRYAGLPAESVAILHYLGSHEKITIADACALITNVSRPTMKNRLSDLVKQGLIKRYGKARATWYTKA